MRFDAPIGSYHFQGLAKAIEDATNEAEELRATEILLTRLAHYVSKSVLWKATENILELTGVGNNPRDFNDR